VSLPRLQTFVVEALKLIGIAAICLVIFGVGFFISIKTGIVVPARWGGLLIWTCGLLWVIFRRRKYDLHNERFWSALIGLLAIHLAVFISVLKRYPDWRMAWFPIVFVIEGSAMSAVLDTVVDGRHRTKSKHSG
jgi:hypothetical protein